MTFGLRLIAALVAGLIVSFIYLSYRTWLCGQQKKLLYDHWEVLGKGGRYRSGHAAHMGEVTLDLGKNLNLVAPAGIDAQEELVDTPVVVAAVTSAGTLLVRSTDGKDNGPDAFSDPAAGGLPGVFKKLFRHLTQTFSSVK
jgi:hypothetical protein